MVGSLRGGGRPQTSVFATGCRPLGRVLSPDIAVLSLPGLGRLLGAALIGRLPQAISTLAILLLVLGATGSYAAACAAVGAYALASAAVAPAQGRLVDRFGRLRVLPPTAVAPGSCSLPWSCRQRIVRETSRWYCCPVSRPRLSADRPDGAGAAA
jgi:MFS family permease